MASGKDLKKALKNTDLTMEEAAQKLNVSRGTLYNYFNVAELDEEIVQNVQERLNIKLNEPVVPYHLQRREQKNIPKAFLVPLVPYKARAGYVKMYDQVDYLDKLEQYAIPPNVDPAGAIWRYFEVGGDSGEPVLRSGDLLLCSQVPREDWIQLRNFHFYVLVTATEVFVKRVYRETEFEWILISENESMYPAIKFPVDTVREVWVVRRHIKKELPPTKVFDIDTIRKNLSE